MTTKRNQLALAFALAYSLGATGVAQAVTVAGSSNTTVRPAEAETITTGTITSIDVARGVLAVSGRVIHFTPKGVAYSDDRRKPPHNGLEGLKAGDKVTVRSVMRDGGNQAVQIVVKD
jgi:ribosomal protein S1